MKTPHWIPFLLWIGALTHLHAQYDEELQPRQNAPVIGPNGTQGILMDEREFLQYWPPKDLNGTPYKISQQGQKDWERDLQTQIKVWEDRQIPKGSRPYPFCVDGTFPNGTDDKNLQRFKSILTSLDIQPQNVKDIVIADENGKPDFGAQESLIDSITFKNIMSPSNNAETRGIGRLNQWVNIAVTASQGLTGLLIQAISGPLGLPFGEFSNNFDCVTDDVNTSWPVTIHVNRYVEDLNRPTHDAKLAKRLMHHIIPCKYPHGHGIKHPTVFAFGGQGHVQEITRYVFRVHFNWEDLQCNNAASMQFLIVTVKDMKNMNNVTDMSNVQIFLTKAFTQKMDSGDGIPYPYHPVWRNTRDKASVPTKTYINCTGDLVKGVADPVTGVVTPPPAEHRFFLNDPDYNNRRIPYNKQYDDCILTGAGLNNSICPPGPFRCSRNSRTVKEMNDQMARDLISASCSPIRKCPHPNDTEPILDTSHLFDVQLDYYMTDLSENADKVLRESRAFHAITMSISWILTIGIGAFIARFYKESCGLSYNAENGCMGMGCWLWIHTGISYISCALMWSGIMDVISIKGSRGLNCEDYNERREELLREYNRQYSPPQNSTMDAVLKMCETRASAITAHATLGWVAAILWHVAFLTGWIRPMGNLSRSIYINIHFYSGYSGKIFASLSTMILGMGARSICEDIYVEIALQEVITICGFLLGTLVQRREDKRLGLGHRKVFPITEGIEVPDIRSFPFQFLLVVKLILQMLMIAMISMTYLYIWNKTIYAPKGGNFDISYGIMGSHDAKNFLTGATTAGECHMPSVKLNAAVARLKDYRKIVTGTNATGKFKF